MTQTQYKDLSRVLTENASCLTKKDFDQRQIKELYGCCPDIKIDTHSTRGRVCVSF